MKKLSFLFFLQYSAPLQNFSSNYLCDKKIQDSEQFISSYYQCDTSKIIIFLVVLNQRNYGNMRQTKQFRALIHSEEKKVETNSVFSLLHVVKSLLSPQVQPRNLSQIHSVTRFNRIVSCDCEYLEFQTFSRKPNFKIRNYLNLWNADNDSLL